MTLSDLKPGQKVTIDGMLAEYKGIQKVRIPNFGKVEKRVFFWLGSATPMVLGSPFS